MLIRTQQLRQLRTAAAAAGQPAGASVLQGGTSTVIRPACTISGYSSITLERITGRNTFDTVFNYPAQSQRTPPAAPVPAQRSAWQECVHFFKFSIFCVIVLRSLRLIFFCGDAAYDRQNAAYGRHLARRHYRMPGHGQTRDLCKGTLRTPSNHAREHCGQTNVQRQPNSTPNWLRLALNGVDQPLEWRRSTP